MAIFRVWTKDKYRGKLISANKLDEMLMKIKTKFELGMDCSIKLVLSDGCEIDDDDSFETLENVDLFFLKNGEELNIPGPSSTNASNPTTLIDLVKKIRQKKTGLNDQCTQAKKKKTTAKLNIGWMIFENDRYSQVRSQKGISKKGTWEQFINMLGDFKKNIIPECDFTVGDYIKKHCLTTKPRVYLMSKPVDQSHDDLPELDSLSDLPELDSLSDDLNDTPALFDGMVSDVENLPEPSISENGSTVSEPHGNDAVIIIDGEETLPGPLDEHTYGNNTSNSSPVSIRLPRIPSCEICTDRYSDSFLECGHILCFVCATELQERGSRCHICRKSFSKILKLYY